MCSASTAQEKPNRISTLQIPWGWTGSRSALYRSQTGYYADFIEEAAALWESLSQNHPFVDGNKRTAFAAAYTFLAINGRHFTADAEETGIFLCGLYDSSIFTYDRLVAWLRAHVTEQSRP